MYRYFRQLETPVGDTVVYSDSELSMLRDFAGTLNLEIAALDVGFISDVGLGAITDSTSITVTGHSLGGHLSTWLSAFLGARVDHTYTYNGAGIGGFGFEVFDLIKQFVLNADMHSLDNNRISNIYAEQDVEVTAGLGMTSGNDHFYGVSDDMGADCHHKLPPKILSQTRRELIHEGSTAASMRQTA